MTVALRSGFSGALTSSRVTFPEIVGGISPSVLLSRLLGIDDAYSNLSERIAGAKIMNGIAAFYIDEGLQDISARYADGYLKPSGEVQQLHGTVQSINAVVTEAQADSIKTRLHNLLSEHQENPVTYRMEDSSAVIEFLLHSSRLVCIFDEDGVQLLWRKAGKPNSIMIKNNRLSFEKITQKIALIVSSDNPTGN